MATDIEYFDGKQRCLGVLVTPDEAQFPGKRPGIVAVHEAWGLGAQIKRRAAMLADLGFVVLAADIFGDRYIPRDPPEGLKIIADFGNDLPLLRGRVAAAVAALKKEARCDGRIGAVGYCFGGQTVLELARSGHPDVIGIVSFHGGLTTTKPAEKGKVKAKILACHGAEDQFVTHEHLLGFLNEMAAAGADCQTIAYTGAVHAFTNPEAQGQISPTIHYEEKADRRSWQAMKTHFREVFGDIF